MLETVFTTNFEQGPIPVGFHICLEGNFIVVIGPNGSGKTSLLHALFRKNMENKSTTQICLIQLTGNIPMFAQPSGQTFEQYNIELAKALVETNGRKSRPNPSELPMLLLNNGDFTQQVQKLNKCLEYLDLPSFEIQKMSDMSWVRQQAGSFLGVLPILCALITDSIKLVLIDEPAIHLASQKQKLLKDLLQDFSEKKRIIITTHTNIFINKDDYGRNYFTNIDQNRHFSITQATSEALLESIGSAEVKLARALTKAIPSIGPHLMTSLDIEELYIDKQKNADQSTKIIREKHEEINITVFYEELKESIKHNKGALSSRHKERIQQTNITYYVSVFCLILGIILIFIGTILIFAGKLGGGILTTISSTIISIVSGLAFTFNKRANDLEREDTREMRTLEKSSEAMGYISTMTDEVKKNELIEKLIEKHFF